MVVQLIESMKIKIDGINQDNESSDEVMSQNIQALEYQTIQTQKCVKI